MDDTLTKEKNKKETEGTLDTTLDNDKPLTVGEGMVITLISI